MRTEAEILELIETVRQTAYALHVYLGNGYLEKVYENALKNRLEKKGVHVKTQAPLKVYDEDGSVIGDYQADMLVEDSLIVELKATKTIAPEHYAQTMNYLKTTGLKFALLINFGSYKFEVRRIISTFSTSPTYIFYSSTRQRNGVHTRHAAFGIICA